MLFTIIRQNFRSLQNFQDVVVKYDCQGTVPINDKLHVMNISTLEDLHNFVSDLGCGIKISCTSDYKNPLLCICC